MVKITAAQLGLFIGAQVRVTDAFIEEVKTEFGYTPSYDTKTPFILQGVSVSGFTISTENGAVMKIFGLPDYGKYARLQLKPMGQIEHVQAMATATELVDEYNALPTPLNWAVLLDSISIYAAVSNFTDVFQWINAGLADRLEIKAEQDAVARLEIQAAIEEIIEVPLDPEVKVWYYLGETDEYFCKEPSKLTTIEEALAVEIADTTELPENATREQLHNYISKEV